jgi:raffinose/stachyose/melibiose transport system permease protein
MLAAAGTLAVNYYALYHMDGGWTEALRVFFNLIFQKFFRTIPAALEESARLDGCSDLRLFFKIILPITKPVIFTMALITAIGQWNDFYMPMVLLGNKNVTTLTLAIYRYVGQFTKYMSESMAAVVITLIPIIIIYFVFSSQIVEGLTGGAVKG